jgi:large subunit ribosomal protein L4
MASAPLFSATGQPAGETPLADAVFGAKINEPLLHQAVVRELANRRQGTHDTKSRGEVKGGGKKPYRQKGTGRARQGSTRAPHYRTGGIVHGPTPRSYRQSMPQKMRRAAVKAALSSKAQGAGIKVLEALTLAEISTKQLAALLNTVGIEGRTLLIVAEKDETVALSARNIPNVSLRVLPGLSTYEVMQAKNLLFTRAAVERLEQEFAE